jgi:hypothetical protein
MPSLKHHCIISIKRTDKDYRDLHEWIDENKDDKSVDHRSKNHYYTRELRDFVYEKFGGNEAVGEWLFHIALDNLDTSVLNDWKFGKIGTNFYKFGFIENGFIYYKEDELTEEELEEEFCD